MFILGYWESIIDIIEGTLKMRLDDEKWSSECIKQSIYPLTIEIYA